MKYRAVLLLSIFALASNLLFLQGCVAYSDKVRTETQSIRVTSDPPGAMITVKDEDGIRKLGATPVLLNGSYEVVERSYNKAACALTGAAELSDLVIDDDGELSEGEAAFGLIAMVVGAAAGAASCTEADGVVAIRPTSLIVSAHLNGYRPEQVSLQIPKKHPILYFELSPLAGATAPGPVAEASPAPAPAPQARPAEPVPGQLVVFDLQAAGGQIEPQLLADLSAYLTASILDADVYPLVLRDRLLAVLGQQGSICSDIDCRTRVARQLGAEYILDTRVVKTETVCLVSASLIKVNTSHQKLIAATQATCDELGLMAAMDTISELVVDPPEQAEPNPPPPDDYHAPVAPTE